MAQPKVYPASLPQYPLLKHDEGMPDNLVRNEMDSGPPSTRAISTNPQRAVKMDFMLTDAQKATLKTFFTDTLVQGSLEWTHFLPDDPGTPVVFQFTKPPMFKNMSFDLWKVRYDLIALRDA